MGGWVSESWPAFAHVSRDPGFQVHVRVYGPFERTLAGNELLVAMIDPFSGWVLARPTRKGEFLGVP